ncbi:lysine-rich arabinogalactan protein 19-like [Arachis duranensis]|uniref:Lysine-rich arabinogalactan protein 19-like n=1 Tax=Arachis duranensis TaxID=130453 RepID=A0A6P4D353_ARADU|nr:lysine-rich arabinogalactan protein 19-like [Arachis duranensis]
MRDAHCAVAQQPHFHLLLLLTPSTTVAPPAATAGRATPPSLSSLLFSLSPPPIPDSSLLPPTSAATVAPPATTTGRAPSFLLSSQPLPFALSLSHPLAASSLSPCSLAQPPLPSPTHRHRPRRHLSVLLPTLPSPISLSHSRIFPAPGSCSNFCFR